MEIEITPKRIVELSEGFVQAGELIAKRIKEVTRRIKSQKMIYSTQDINELEKISQAGINYLIGNSAYINMLSELLEKIDPKDEYAEDKRKDLSMILNYQSSLHQMMNKIIIDDNSMLEMIARLGDVINIKNEDLN